MKFCIPIYPAPRFFLNSLLLRIVPPLFLDRAVSNCILVIGRDTQLHFCENELERARNMAGEMCIASANRPERAELIVDKCSQEAKKEMSLLSKEGSMQITVLLELLE